MEMRIYLVPLHLLSVTFKVKYLNFSNLQVYGMCLLKLLKLCNMLKELSKDNGLLIPLKSAA